MKMIIRKRKITHEIVCNYICHGIVNVDNGIRTSDFFIQFDSENLSDTFEIHFDISEQEHVLAYLTNKNK